MSADRKLKIGMVSPYGWDVPGGVQVHIKQLAEHFIAQGHEVSVIAPVSDDDLVTEPWVVSAGRPLPIPFNGSIARVLFGPIASSRVRQWIEAGEFDLLHLHEPGIPSLSLLACWSAEGPMVGTFHASTTKLRAIAAAGGLIEPMIEKLSARIAVSEMAHDTMTSLYGTSAVIIPNGIDFEHFAKDRGAKNDRTSFRIGFLGRFEEERKGLPVLLAALPAILATGRDIELVVAGPGDPSKYLRGLDPAILKRITFLGRLSDDEKAEFLQSLDVYIAPNTGGESLQDGACGALFENEDSAELARVVSSLYADRSRIAELSLSGIDAAKRYDWKNVGAQILSVYETSMAGNGKVGVGSESASWKRGK